MEDKCWCGNEVEVLEENGMFVRGKCMGCGKLPAQCECEKDIIITPSPTIEEKSV